MWVSVRQWNGHGSDAARAHGPRQSRPFFSVMNLDGVTRAIQVTPPSLGQCLSSERPEQKFPEVSIDRCVSPGVDRSLWDESSSPSTSDLRLEVCGGTDNRKLRLCGSPVCDEHEATERGQRSSRGVGPLRCVGGKKDATNRWVSRVVGEYMCVCLRVSVCVCVYAGGCSRALLSDALAGSAHLAVQFHHLQHGFLSAAAQMVKHTVMLLRQPVQHAEHITWERERRRAIRMRWKCCIICSRLILISRHVTLMKFNSMLERTSYSPHAPPLRHREWLWKVTNYVTVNPAEVSAFLNERPRAGTEIILISDHFEAQRSETGMMSCWRWLWTETSKERPPPSLYILKLNSARAILQCNSIKCFFAIFLPLQISVFNLVFSWNENNCASRFACSLMRWKTWNMKTTKIFINSFATKHIKSTI